MLENDSNSYCITVLAVYDFFEDIDIKLTIHRKCLDCLINIFRSESKTFNNFLPEVEARVTESCIRNKNKNKKTYFGRNRK